MMENDNNTQKPGLSKLWAPWRSVYIKNSEPLTGCLFCEKAGMKADKDSLIVYRGDTAFVIMNKYPYNNGHVMIVPYKHTNRLEDLDKSERLELFHLLELSQKALSVSLQPHGYNSGINFGRAAGAGIEDHLHIHLVPRWNGDTNFMPVTGSVKVISEALDSTWAQLKDMFKVLTDLPSAGSGL